MDDERFSAYFALDGKHLDGLIGSGGILRFDWPERKIYVQYYEGISAAHNPSISPNGKMVLLGNFSQQIFLLDVANPHQMKPIARQATQYYEEIGYRLRGNTHHLWYPDNQRFIGAIGKHVYRFDINHLTAAEQLGPHLLENAHELRWDASRRWILIGDLGPERRDVRQVCVFDLEDPLPEKRAKVIHVTNNVWHVCVHPTKPLGYAFTYSLTTDNENWVEWSPFYAREYIYEIDLPSARIVRTWSCGAEYPVHLNSDVECTEDAIYIASGGSHSVVVLPLADFAAIEVHYDRPNWFIRRRSIKQDFENLLGGFMRRATLTSSHYMLQTLRVTGWQIADGVYATRVSPGGRYVVVGNRGYNMLSVYDRRTFKRVYRRLLPFRNQNFDRNPNYTLGMRGYHLGIHHSEITAR